MSYNLVGGLSNYAANVVLNSIYESLYPAIFKQTIDISNTDSFDIDIQAAPSLDFSENDAMRENYEKQLAESYLDAKQAKEVANEMATNQTVGFNLSSIAFVIHQEGKPALRVSQAGLAGQVKISTQVSEGKNYLVCKLVTAKVTCDKSIIERIINQRIDKIIEFLNDQFLSKVEIPGLDYSSLHLTFPKTAVQNQNFMLYSALVPNQVEIPNPYDWGGDLFIGVDRAIIRKAIETELPLTYQTGFDWTIVNGSVSYDIGEIHSIEFNNNGSISISLGANFFAGLTISPPWPLPDVPIHASADGKLNITLTPAVENSKVIVKINHVDDFDIDWKFDGIPIPGLGFALTEAIKIALQAGFNGESFFVYGIPDFPIGVDGKNMVVSLKNLDPSIGGPNNDFLLLNANIEVKEGFTGKNSLQPGETLQLGQYLASKNGLFQLLLQESDGNLVMYDIHGTAIWAAHTNGKGAISANMQHDGNFVIYKSDRDSIWATHTNRSEDNQNSIVLQNDRNLVIYDKNRKSQWSSHSQI